MEWDRMAGSSSPPSVTSEYRDFREGVRSRGAQQTAAEFLDFLEVVRQAQGAAARPRGDLRTRRGILAGALPGRSGSVEPVAVGMSHRPHGEAGGCRTQDAAGVARRATVETV